MNREAILNMLQMQHRMNSRVHEDWINQHFEWYRATWIECGELMDHVGYKWWKKQAADMEQVRLEVVDIWHFGMSALFLPDTDLETLAGEIADDFTVGAPVGSDEQSTSQRIHAATEALAQHALETKGFSVSLFHALMQACDLSADALYRHYVGKNVLNFFRQDHGYQDGTYIKEWQGREDNEHLSELLESLDATAAGFPEAVYEALTSRYADVT
jgi:dimeric dUTPase (all-alpha-NTP-PPase superfamily)